MQHELRGYDGSRKGERRPMHGGEGGDGAVGERVWEWAQADHDEEFDAVMFERQSEGSEALVFGDEAVDHVLEQISGEEEGHCATSNCRRCSNVPSEHVSVFRLASHRSNAEGEEIESKHTHLENHTQIPQSSTTSSILSMAGKTR